MDELKPPAAEVGTVTEPTPAPEESAAELENAAEESREEFAKLFEETGAKPEAMPQRGEKIACRVVKVGEDNLFVSFGGKSEGVISRAEFAAEGEEAGDRPPLPAEGDTVEAYVLSRDGGEIVLTIRLSRRDQSRTALQDAYTAGVPVEGRVVKVIKGGFEVRVSGLRAFCPLSQIELRWPKEPESYVNQIFAFKVIEYKDKGRNIIVSRRALLEAEQVTLREEMKKRIHEGAVVRGRVRNVQPFGAFVELGGVDGLIPVSEMSWTRVENATEVLQEGQEVVAKVIGADWGRERISLSLKALQGDPWAAVPEKYKVGQRLTGTVARLANFGAFVELEPGIDGMIHISALGADKRVKHPKEVLNVGDTVEAEIVAVEPEKRRIALSLDYKLFEGLGDLPREGVILTGTVEKVTDFGVFLKLPSGHVGLIPNIEMNTRKGADHGQMFKPGVEIEAQVLEVADRGRRIRLSVRAAARERDRQAQKEYEAYKGTDKPTFGTFGDLLKKRGE